MPPRLFPSIFESPPKLASKNRSALTSIASKTEARSPGEELMTCKTSAFALQRVAFGCAFVEFAMKFSDGSPKIGNRVARHRVRW
jgi:hypothetical protein